MKILGVILGLAAIMGCAPVDNSSWALTHVSVVDVVNGRIEAEQTVHIRGDRIVSVSPTETTALPENVRRIDVSGAFVVRGLFDMHAHTFCAGEDCGQQPKLARYVAAGVLGIRDMGSPLDAITEIAKDETSVRPAIWFTGPILDGPRGSQDSMRLAVENEDQARNAVMTLSRSGVHFIKVHDWLTHSAYLAIADSARSQDLPVVGHVPATVSIDDAITAGQKSVEHLGGLTHSVLRACGRTDTRLRQEVLRRGSEMNKRPAYELLMSSAYLTPLLDTFDPNLCIALAKRLGDAKVWQTPTLVLWRLWADSQEMRGSPEDKGARRRLFDTYRHIVQIMYKAGVPILAGTDEIPGTTIDDELDLLVSAGLPPIAALQATTIKAAEFLGVSDSYGSITPSHLANLVVVEGDPLTDIRNLKKIRMVVLRGQQVNKVDH